MANLRDILNAQKNRQELIKAKLNRRDLFKMGLLTSAGYLVRKNGLSAWAFDGGCNPGICRLGCSPPIQPFLDPLPIIPVLPQRPLTDPGLQFGAPPQKCPNNATNPATGLPFEGRGQFNGVLRSGTDCFQFFDQYPPQQFFVERARQNTNFRITSDATIPPQTIWGWNLGGSDPSDVAQFPNPTIVVRYQTPWVVRRFNELSPATDGFGVNELSSHLHNFHSAPESDGGPCRWFFKGQYFDYYWTAQQAGFASDFPPNGDIRESLSSLWYHDHRIDHTAENTYKGLEGFLNIFNQFDTGDEGTGFHLPSFPQFDINVILNDKLIDPGTGKVCFDTFGFDGLVGDVQLANGKVQPFLNVNQRRYRFRVLDGGPSRFYQLFLTNPANLNQQIPFWVIANDGNLLTHPVQVTSFRIGVAERYDIIIDFKQIAQTFGATTLNLENRLQQTNGRAPTNNILPAGQGTTCVQFRLGAVVADGSVDPATNPTFYQLPPTPTPRITRFFKFERDNGQWAINGQFADCGVIRFTVEQNTGEDWHIINSSGGWQHPIHIHLEEFQIRNRNGAAPPAVEVSRKDVIRLQFNEDDLVTMRFRDFVGDYPTHCHNTIHEDHAMLLLWQVQPNVIDNNQNP